MRLVFFSGLLILCLHIYSQKPGTVSVSEVSRIEKALAADDMQGRQVFTPGIEKAASFITGEFEKAGLKPLPGSDDFRQTFTMTDGSIAELSATLDGIMADPKNIILYSADSSVSISSDSPYKKIFVKTPAAFNEALFTYLTSDSNVVVFVDTSVSKRFTRLAGFHMPQFQGSGNRIFVLTATEPRRFSFYIRQNIKRKSLTNLAGIIPGKSKPDEYVIFSAHYDHLGVGKPDAAGDSIFNGANDDASGTTAVLTLARYFREKNDNQRTLVFAAFTAEEIGEFGSAYFSRHLDPDKVMAMMNIEMIGTESKWGKNSAYITGFEKSDLGAILQKNLLNSPFSFYPDPYPEQMLFLRSDNATLAKRGVPAHTISTSKMDSEKYYHTRGDAVETLDLNNMTEIIRAIGISAGTIISGQDTPRRLKNE